MAFSPSPVITSSSHLSSTSTSIKLHTEPIHALLPSTGLQRPKDNLLASLRALYSTAVRSFLHKDHLSVWISLCEGLEKISSVLEQVISTSEDVHQPWWLGLPGAPLAQVDRELHELLRKFNILRITFVTSVYSSNAIGSIRSLVSSHASPEHRSLTQTLLRLLALKPDLLLSALWTMAASRQEDPAGCLRNHASDHLSAVFLMDVHPSVVTALALASIKLSVLQTGRAICETWISSLNAVVFDNLEISMRIEQASQTTSSVSDKNWILNYPTDKSIKRVGSNFSQDYARLIETYAVHILGLLDDWQFAKDFIQAQGCEAGGVLPVEIATNVLDALNAHQLQAAQMAQATRQRLQREQEEREAAAKKVIKPSNGRHVSPPSPTDRARSEQRQGRMTASPSRTRSHKPTALTDGDDPSHFPSSALDEDHRVLSKSSTGSSRTLTCRDRHHQSNTVLRHHLDNYGDPKPSKGFTALRQNLARFISHSPPELDRQTKKIGLLSSIISLIRINPIRLVTITAVLVLFTKLRRRGIGYWQTIKNSWWWLQWLLNWCWIKLSETARMGTRITYLP